MKPTWRERILAHYHWIVAAVVFLEFTVALGLANNIYSLFLIPVTESLGVTRGAFSIAPSIKYLAAFVSNLFFGACYHRWGYRHTTTISLVLTAVAYMGYALARDVTPFYIGAVLVGLSEAFFSTAGTSRIITDWFHRHQGLILGVVMASSGVGGTLFSVGMQAVMEAADWRMALGGAAVLLLLSAAAVFLLVRDAPAWMGLQPYGDAEDRKREREKLKKRAERPMDWEGFPIAHLRRQPYFYLILVATFLAGLIHYGVFPVVVAHVQDQGLSASAAASVQGLMFLALAGAKILEGLLCDAFNAKKVMLLCLLCDVVGVGMLASSKSIGVAMAAVSIYSFGLAIPSIMMPVLTTELFGRRDYGTVLGVQLAILSLSGVVASPATNFSYDLLGSYVPAFYVFSLLAVVTMLLYFVVFRAAGRDRKRYEAQER